MGEADGDTYQIIKKYFEKLSNLSIDLESKRGPFPILIDLIYNISMLVIEEGPENEISEDEFKVSIEKAFSNSKLFK
jgi:hypothetical protein